jgi:hypothetical protein
MADEEHEKRVWLWIAIISGGIAVVAVILEAGALIPFVESFYQAHPNVKGSVTFILAVFAFITIVFSVLLGWHRVVARLEIIHQIQQSIKKLEANEATVRAINPHNPDDFRSVFAGAELIRAYNPPLTLLTTRPEHRKVIFDVLSGSQDVEYRAIVGKIGAARMLELYRKCLEEHPRRTANLALNKMLVSWFDHPDDLHTTVQKWDFLQPKDLRGLSFFLVEYVSRERRTALLYILGEPFAAKFEVPKQSLEIHESGEPQDIFNLLLGTFDERWMDLLARTESRPCPLPDFCSENEAKLEPILQTLGKA